MLKLWDFDNVLFINVEDNYSDSYLSYEKIIEIGELKKYNVFYKESEYNVLLTGRGYFQKEKILKLLEIAGYTFKEHYFIEKEKDWFPAYNREVELKKFFNEYWKYKLKIINEYFYKYVEIIVIDDDKTLIQYCKEKQIPHVYFDIRKKRGLK